MIETWDVVGRNVCAQTLTLSREGKIVCIPLSGREHVPIGIKISFVGEVESFVKISVENNPSNKLVFPDGFYQ